MKQYLDLVREVQERGVVKGDRTGTGTRSLFGTRMEFDLREGFPLLTTKRVHWPSVAGELAWFLRGETNVAALHAMNVTIWDEWSDEDGELGPVYGAQWRSWDAGLEYDGATGEFKRQHYDQLAEVIEQIKANPDSRRLIVSAWNVGQLDLMALPPCHLLFQFYVADGVLELQMYQRSCDLFLGVPFNIASYALLLELVAKLTGLTPGRFIWVGGDTHIYSNHEAQFAKQLEREPRALPRLEWLRVPSSPEDFRPEDVRLVGYEPHGGIKGKVSV